MKTKMKSMFESNDQLKPESKIKQVCNQNTCITEFKSITHFMEYIEGTPLNENCRFARLSSSDSDEKFAGTKSYEEAKELLRDGYKVGIEKLQKQFKVNTAEEQKTVKKILLDVAGFQPCVPNYLMGIPQSMFNSKLVPKKQKVLTINKNISYLGYVSAESIVEYSVRTMRIIQALEANGYAINLNVFFANRTSKPNTTEIVKIRIKNSSERLNVSKLAFPLLNPSMLRRLIFRYLEVSDTTPARTTKSMDAIGYGTVADKRFLVEHCKESKEILLDAEVTESDVENLSRLE